MVTILGEALIDLVRRGSETRAHPGGSPFNVAIGVARLGHPVDFIGRVGSDDYGRLLLDTLRTEGVTAVLPPDDLPTSVADAQIDDDGAAAYDFRLHWSLPSLAAEAPGVLARSTLVHTGSIASVLEPGAAEVRRFVEAARSSSTIAFDPNCRPSITPDPEAVRGLVEQYVDMADVVKASDEDLAWLYPGTDPLDAARTWLGRGPAVVVVTRGGSGPWAISAQGECAVEPPRVTVADTVGAGDSFMAAIISGLLDRGLDGAASRDALRTLSLEDLRALLTECAAAAAVTVSRHGAQPPRREELSA
jgi:fructokinase